MLANSSLGIAQTQMMTIEEKKIDSCDEFLKKLIHCIESVSCMISYLRINPLDSLPILLYVHTVGTHHPL